MLNSVLAQMKYLEIDVNCFISFQAMLQYLDKLQKEDMENLIKKHELQRSLMKDVAKANEVYKAVFVCLFVYTKNIHLSSSPLSKLD